jgi:fused signal recognition particle receptor
MTILFLSVGVGVLGLGIAVVLARRKKPAKVEKVEERNPFVDRLSKTRESLFGKASEAIRNEQLDQLEEALLEGDVGAATTAFLIEKLQTSPTSEKKEAGKLIQKEMIKLLSVPAKDLDQWMAEQKPFVISVVGINGAGKTTTIGKLAHYFKSRGKRVLLGAGDTFRAGAIAQLKTWAERTQSEFVTGREGADPGAVAFDSVSAGKAREMDVVIIDTAGRLHTKSNLMEELKKIHKVIKKVIPDAPHETWIVLDGTLGQNSLVQAREFKDVLGVTGVVVTKLDGTAKGGAVLAIAKELSLPVRFVGIGESAEDLVTFQPDRFVDAIFGEANS